MKILMVDDDEDGIQDYRRRLEQAHHEVNWVNTLADAMLLLTPIDTSAVQVPFDLVVIDLMLGCDVPDALQRHHRALSVREHNEGQALGRWLWMEHGLKMRRGGAVHCYFSAVTQNYVPCADGNDIEFSGMQDVPSSGISPSNPRAAFVLSKWAVKPREISERLTRIVDFWRGQNYHGPSPPPGSIP